MFYKRFFIVLLIIACAAFVADDPLVLLQRQLTRWATQQPVEKVYLQFDKPYYAAGDDIWFKAYVVSGVNHQPTSLSGIVNIELVDTSDSVKQSVKLELQNGTAHGDFALADTMHSGSYHIRAYTNYMRNAGSAYFFDQLVNIVNINKAAPAKLIVSGKTDLQFFPESGYLVNGIPAKVAFKALAPDGSSIAVKGVITDNSGKQVASFASSHLGMGVFEFTPIAGVTYQAKMADGGIAQLPMVLRQGYMLSVDNKDAKEVRVKINASADMVNNDIILLAQSGGKVCYNAKLKPGLITISKSKFPGGITQFTLFSATGEPLNERLAFIKPVDLLGLTLTPAQSVYTARQPVKFTLDARVAGNFSVAVTDESRAPVDEDNENNILASLLLTSDLKGYIEQPAYYFNHTDDNAQADLDVLMLTQGYRRFNWKELLNNTLPPRLYEPETSLRVAGTVLTNGGKPVGGATVKLYDLDSIQYTRDAVTDPQGRFVFNELAFPDSVRFIVQARTAKNRKDVVIKMDKPEPVYATYGPVGLPTGIDPVYLESSRRFFALQRGAGLGNHVFTLQEVVIREKQELLRYSANLNGAGNADQIIPGKLLREEACANLSNCLQGRLVGVIFRNGLPYSTRGFGPMQLVVDGIYMPGNYLNSLNYTDIQGIEVLRNGGLTAVYGSRGANGVLLVTTRRGGDDDDIAEPIYGRGITTYYPRGYYKAREFYSPRYDQPRTDKQLADARTTIYWNPQLLTGNDGKIAFNYFNAGAKGTYRVVVEGITADGKLGRAVYRYRVQ